MHRWWLPPGGDRLQTELGQRADGVISLRVEKRRYGVRVVFYLGLGNAVTSERQGYNSECWGRRVLGGG